MWQRAGQVKKLRGQINQQGQVSYTLVLDNEEVPLQSLLGKPLTLSLSGIIHCIACNRTIKKSYQQGYCFPCTQTLAQCDICIIKPELCHHRHGTCREPEWAEQHCLQSHYVYLANASGIKVGITRGSNIPTRWIDQGASQALPVLEVKDRYTSGLVEVLFKTEVADKTNWRKMLQGQPEMLDLVELRDRLLTKLEPELQKLEAHRTKTINVLQHATVLEFHYPVLEYPTAVKKAEFNQQGILQARLLGIKGQYFILDQGVINIRNLVGEHLTVSLHDKTVITEGLA